MTANPKAFQNFVTQVAAINNWRDLNALLVDQLTAPTRRSQPVRGTNGRIAHFDFTVSLPNTSLGKLFVDAGVKLHGWELRNTTMIDITFVVPVPQGVVDDNLAVYTFAATGYTLPVPQELADNALETLRRAAGGTNLDTFLQMIS